MGAPQSSKQPTLGSLLHPFACFTNYIHSLKTGPVEMQLSVLVGAAAFLYSAVEGAPYAPVVGNRTLGSYAYTGLTDVLGSRCSL